MWIVWHVFQMKICLLYVLSHGLCSPHPSQLFPSVPLGLLCELIKWGLGHSAFPFFCLLEPKTSYYLIFGVKVLHANNWSMTMLIICNIFWRPSSSQLGSSIPSIQVEQILLTPRSSHFASHIFGCFFKFNLQERLRRVERSHVGVHNQNWSKHF